MGASRELANQLLFLSTTTTAKLMLSSRTDAIPLLVMQVEIFKPAAFKGNAAISFAMSVQFIARNILITC